MKYKIPRLARCTCLLAALLSSICHGHAQEVTARLDGTIKDTAGAVVPEAPLSARNVSTGVVTTATSDLSGNYVFASLAPGTYTLSVKKPGFATRMITGITLQVAQKATVDLTLNVGQVNQTVTVEATAPLVDSTSASMGTVVNEQPILDL